MLNTTGVIRSSEVLSFYCNVNRRVYWIGMKDVTKGCAAGFQGWSWRGSQGRRGEENNEKKLTQKNLSVTSGHASLLVAQECPFAGISFGQLICLSVTVRPPHTCQDAGFPVSFGHISQFLFHRCSLSYSLSMTPF